MFITHGIFNKVFISNKCAWLKAAQAYKSLQSHKMCLCMLVCVCVCWLMSEIGPTAATPWRSHLDGRHKCLLLFSHPLERQQQQKQQWLRLWQRGRRPFLKLLSCVSCAELAGSSGPSSSTASWVAAEVFAFLWAGCSSSSRVTKQSTYWTRVRMPPRALLISLDMFWIQLSKCLKLRGSTHNVARLSRKPQVNCATSSCWCCRCCCCCC